MDSKSNQRVQVPVSDKVLWSLKEAAEFSNISMYKLKDAIKDPECPFAIQVGHRMMIRRQDFLDYLATSDKL